MKKFLLAVILFLAGTVGAQTAKLPDAPSPHRFLDRTNQIAFTTYAAAVVMDSISTQRFMAYGHVHNTDGSFGIPERNPIAKHFVGTREGQGFISAVGFGAVIGGCYVAHRQGWHRLERWLPIVVGSTETFLTVSNYNHVRRYDALIRQK
jgi:hypothetical protein